METISNPIMDNLRLALEKLREEKVSFKKVHISYGGDSIQVTALSLVPKTFRVDDNGIYINT